MKRFWKTLWYIRCIFAWIFRVLSVVVGVILMIGIVVFGITDPVNFNKVAPPPFGGIGLGIAVFGCMVFLDLIGRLLSWTHPFDDLPRFRDFYWIERWKRY